ncbi:hypothetical protein QJS10_CPB15g02142 [Acorus calamus]|uniref:Uncharacterized protein n=1 Tax=Acorus calamus TaxID=4465 RepID=A0AAV9D7W0_ACOCL|nr:hypothetical protein QJS10_CPB15g02142 [Acorus calamus]
MEGCDILTQPRCIKYLQRQSSPTGVALAEDEFILHVEGTARTQRVVRHIGQTSWPGRLTLTNRALYFEASKAVSYEDALKLDLSRPDVDHRVNAGSTGPWGAPLFDKAMIYESTQLSEPVVLEFPELTGSTRRDHWLALTKEVIFLHRFLSKFQIEPPLRAWEVQARTILGIFRLHAAREMLRISPPVPSSFLIFYLFEELPKGDYVLEELSNSLGGTDAMHPCSATLILKRLNISHRVVEDAEVKEGLEGPAGGVTESLVSLETTIGQARERRRSLSWRRRASKGSKRKELLIELLSPLNQVLPWFQRILSWENPLITLVVLTLSMLITYKEWIGYALATFLLLGVIEMLRARHKKMAEKCNEIVVSTSSEQTTMESIVSAQHGLNNFHAAVQKANIAILKIWSIVVSRAPKHANSVMLVMAGAAVLLMMVPFKYVIMATTLLFFASNSKAGKSMSDEQSNRRLREWWDSIPVIPVRIVSDGMTS